MMALVMRAAGQRAAVLDYSSPLCPPRRWRSRPMNHPITNAANRDAMITPMLTSTFRLLILGSQLG
jgi:hypothetical protein